MPLSKALSVKALEEKVNAAPDSYSFARLADAYRKRGDVVSAISICKDGLRRHPYYPTGLVILGRCYLEQENLSEAITQFQDVCRIDRRNTIALKMLADIFVKQGDQAKAGELYAVCARLNPHNATFIRLAKELGGNAGKSVFTILGIEAQASESPEVVTRAFSNSTEIFSNSPELETIQPHSDFSLSHANEESFEITSVSEDLPGYNDVPVVEEIVDDIGGTAALTLSGDDIGDRMNLLFGKEGDDNLSEDDLNKTIAINRSHTGSYSLSDAVNEPSVELVENRLSDGGEIDFIGGDDISARVEELFQKQQTHDTATLAQEAAETHGIEDNLNELFSVATDAYQPETPVVDEVDDAVSQTRVYPLPANQNIFGSTLDVGADVNEAVSGIDVASRIEELFSDDEESASLNEMVSAPQSNPVISDEIFAPIPHADQNQKIQGGEDLFADVAESFDISALQSESEDLFELQSPLSSDLINARTIAIDRSDLNLETNTSVQSYDSHNSDIVSDSISDAAYSDTQSIYLNETMPLDSSVLSASLQDAVDSNEAKTDALQFDELLADDTHVHETEKTETTMLDTQSDSGDQMPSGDEVATILESIFSDDAVVDLGVSHEMQSEPQPTVAMEYEPDLVETADLDRADLIETTSHPLPSNFAPPVGIDVEQRLEEMFPVDPLSASMDVTMIPDDDEETMVSAQGFYNVIGEDAGSKIEEISDETLEAEMQEQEDVPLHDTVSLVMEAQEIEEHVEEDTGELTITHFENADTIEIPENTYAIPDHVITPTLADIYFQQGQPLLAIEIYRRILQKDPDNLRILARIEEIQGSMNDNSGDTRSFKSEPVFFDTDTTQLTRSEAGVESMPVRSRRKPHVPHDKPLKGVRIRKKPRQKGD